MNHTVDIECGITLLTFPRPTKKKKKKVLIPQTGTQE